jgi:hypothetical protein
MDMLARISEAVRENPHIVAGQTPLAAAIAAARSIEASSASDDEDDDDFSTESDTPMSNRTTLSNIPKKLPPGLTSLKNERRFVEHNYHDHALDLPTPAEVLQNPVGDMVPFPFRMHDILSRMDVDGYADTYVQIKKKRLLRLICCYVMY